MLPVWVLWVFPAQVFLINPINPNPMKKAGRPRIQLEDLPKGWEDKMIKLSKQGASIVELSVELGICRDTFYALSEREPKFSDTVKICKQYCEAWWMKQGRTQLENKDFSYTGWYMNMKNRFKWTDRQETTHEGGDKPITTIVSLGTGIDPNEATD